MLSGSASLPPLPKSTVNSTEDTHLSSLKPAIIQLRGVEKVYKSASGNLRALKGINLDIFPGEFIAVIGQSGAGKTTLINMVTGVDHSTAGEVWVDGVPVHLLDDSQLALWRGINIGIIYQSFFLMPTLSLLDNVILPMDFCGLYHRKESLERAKALLTRVGLEKHVYKNPSAISGGQQQRVAIARALANDPKILVADEPTGRLDSSTAESMFQIFDSLIQSGKTILMVSHDRSLKDRVSRVIQIEDGVIRDGN
jgi:putative ABC transport system ATP-binding protein